jgi:hypothetical protein
MTCHAMNDRAPEVAIEYRRDKHDVEYNSEDEQLENMATRIWHLAYNTAGFSGDSPLYPSLAQAR